MSGSKLTNRIKIANRVSLLSKIIVNQFSSPFKNIKQNNFSCLLVDSDRKSSQFS